MKNILVADTRAELLATLEPILKHWGYRVLSTRSAQQVGTFLSESKPCMLIIGEELLASPELVLDEKARKSLENGSLPCVALRQDGVQVAGISPAETIEVPLEIFSLFSFIQRHVEKHPRVNLRLQVKLPGMFSPDGDEFILADVLSLSINGLFFKAAGKIKKGDRLTVVFPLLGQCKEIEVQASVLYTVRPEVSNNFSQGFGVCFDAIPQQHQEQLKKFIRDRFLAEVSSRQDGVGDFTQDQLRD